MIEAVILAAYPVLAQSEFDALLSLVSPEKQGRIKRYRLYRDAQNALLCDVLARSEICRITGIGNNQIEFSSSAYGKPFLAGNPRIHFNVSHSSRYIAGVFDDHHVGIDIEAIKPVDLKIAERFFSPDETSYILSSQTSQRTQRFFEIWTKKESRIKLEGAGLSMPLRSFSVLDSAAPVYYHQVFRNEEAICHVCTAKREMPPARVFSTSEFLEYSTHSLRV
jgi:4'-phosphopantetheinyl transferase